MKKGESALFFAAQQGNADIVKQLHKSKANIDARDMVRRVFTKKTLYFFSTA